jgi:hypothetical protein
MKKVLLVLILFIQCSIYPQFNFNVQITNGDFDARNPFIYKDEYAFHPRIFFELHNNECSNIYSVQYNSENYSFEDTIAVTTGNYQNLNPEFKPSKGLIYQTNKNGNWDIILIPDSLGEWGQPVYLANSNNNETLPKFLESTYSYWNTDSLSILYRKNDDIEFLTYKQNQISEEVVFENSSELSYTEFVGLELEDWGIYSGYYAFAVEEDNNQNKNIVKRFKPYNGNWQEKIILKDSCDCSGLSVQLSDYIAWGLVYSDTVAGEKKLFVMEDAIYSNPTFIQLPIPYDGQLSDFDSYQTLLVGKSPDGKPLDFQFYEPHTYLVEQNGTTKVRCSLWDFGLWQEDSLVEVSVINPDLAIGALGDDYLGFAVYTVWEDSADGHIHLFGSVQHVSVGNVENESYANDFVLYQNYPNPFNPATKIEYKLLQTSDVKFNVFNILGEKVFEQNFGYQTAGSYKINFSGKDLSSGVYVYSIYTGENRLSRKMVLMK